MCLIVRLQLYSHSRRGLDRRTFYPDPSLDRLRRTRRSHSERFGRRLIPLRRLRHQRHRGRVHRCSIVSARQGRHRYVYSAGDAPSSPSRSCGKQERRRQRSGGHDYRDRARSGCSWGCERALSNGHVNRRSLQTRIRPMYAAGSRM